MGDKTKIEWTDATWNPVRGCQVVSPGCANCYAAGIAARFSGPGQPYEGLAKRTKAGPVWTGKVALVREKLDLPLRWRKPRRIFVNSMSDLFHPEVPDDFIAEVFGVMALAPQHVYQILSKRPARMREYMCAPDRQHRIAQAMDALAVDREHDPIERWAPIPGYEGYEASTHGGVRSDRGTLSTTLNPEFDREQVTLWNKGQPRTWYVHALVLMAHRGLPVGDQEACHRDGHHRDNRLANLRWGTRSENQREKVRHGSRGGPQKLTLEQVAAIRAARAAGGVTQQELADRYGVSRSLISMIEGGQVGAGPDLPWPLPNVWLGTSVERQREADERIPHLLQTPAAVRFLSCEPLLGPVDLKGWIEGPEAYVPLRFAAGAPVAFPRIDWVIAGGESGPHARPMHPDWARSLRDQCQKTGVAYFFKQWGEYVPLLDGTLGEESWRANQGNCYVLPSPSPGSGAQVFRVGKRSADRLLDGEEHNAFPRVEAEVAA